MHSCWTSIQVKVQSKSTLFSLDSLCEWVISIREEYISEKYIKCVQPIEARGSRRAAI